MDESHFHCIKQTLTGILCNQFEMCLVQGSTHVSKNLGCTVQQLVVRVPCIRSWLRVFSRQIFARRLQRAILRGGWIKSRNESLNNVFFGPRHPVAEWCTNPGRHLAMATKFCAVAPYIHGGYVWPLLDSTLLAPTILRRLLDFRKICALLV